MLSRLVSLFIRLVFLPDFSVLFFRICLGFLGIDWNQILLQMRSALNLVRNESNWTGDWRRRLHSIKIHDGWISPGRGKDYNLSLSLIWLDWDWLLVVTSRGLQPPHTHTRPPGLLYLSLATGGCSSRMGAVLVYGSVQYCTATRLGWLQVANILGTMLQFTKLLWSVNFNSWESFAQIWNWSRIISSFM